MSSLKRLRKLCDSKKSNHTTKRKSQADSSDSEEEYSFKQSKSDNSSSKVLDCDESYSGDEVSHSTIGTKSFVR